MWTISVIASVNFAKRFKSEKEMEMFYSKLKVFIGETLILDSDFCKERK